MELLNLTFALLVIKIAVCILPGVFGIYLLIISEEKKRELRNALCDRLFGVSNAIPLPNFGRTLLVLGIVGLLISGILSWFILISKIF